MVRTHRIPRTTTTLDGSNYDSFHGNFGRYSFSFDFEFDALSIDCKFVGSLVVGLDFCHDLR